jgi:hypothetical protein
MANFRRLGELMEDILTYSAAENAPQKRVVISLNDPLEIALANLQHHIEVAGAEITVEELPTVPTDRTQMVMVFQNLIGNGIKYRRGERPVIRIDAVRNDGHWRLSVSDNGQGFHRVRQHGYSNHFEGFTAQTYRGAVSDLLPVSESSSGSEERYGPSRSRESAQHSTSLSRVKESEVRNRYASEVPSVMPNRVRLSARVSRRPKGVVAFL